jgi:hypothetical protein
LYSINMLVPVSLSVRQTLAYTEDIHTDTTAEETHHGVLQICLPSCFLVADQVQSTVDRTTQLHGDNSVDICHFSYSSNCRAAIACTGRFAGLPHTQKDGVTTYIDATTNHDCFFERVETTNVGIKSKGRAATCGLD